MLGESARFRSDVKRFVDGNPSQRAIELRIASLGRWLDDIERFYPLPSLSASVHEDIARCTEMLKLPAWKVLLRRAAMLPDGEHPVSAFDDESLGAEAQKKGLASLIQRQLITVAKARSGRCGGLYRVTPLGAKVAAGELILVQAPKHPGGGGPSAFTPCHPPPTAR